jgi:hypothetical protein
MEHHRDKILSLIDDLFDVGRDLAKALAIAKLGDQAIETSMRIETPAQGDDGELLTTTQIAKRLNYSTRTIQQFKIEGMPYIGEGRSTRFELSKALEWIKTHRGKNNRASIRGNGKIAQAPIRTRLQAKRT